MDYILLLKALILGIVEGLTEFLPISSTGHLIVAGDLLDFNDERGKVFEIAIQLAAILAVVWEFRGKIGDVIVGLMWNSRSQKFVKSKKFTINLIIAFLPAAILGILLIKTIKLYLFNPITVATAFIIGGFLILWAEKRPHQVRIRCVEDMTWQDALKIGCAQSLALIPGTSRSGATIIGGLFLGLDRYAATEFSFFLAIPTMFAATLYDVIKHMDLLHLSDMPMFLVGGLASFISAFLAVRGLLGYIKQHDFTVFAWYRIAFGILVLVTAHMGLINWSSAA